MSPISESDTLNSTNTVFFFVCLFFKSDPDPILHVVIILIHIWCFATWNFWNLNMNEWLWNATDVTVLCWRRRGLAWSNKEMDGASVANNSNGGREKKEKCSYHHLVITLWIPIAAVASMLPSVTSLLPHLILCVGDVDYSHNLWLVTSVIINPTAGELVHSTLRIRTF